VLGTKLGGDRHQPHRQWVDVLDSFGNLLPAYPSTAVIVVAKVPEPPVLTDEMGKPRALRLAALGYRAAIEHAYGEPSRVLVEAQRKDYKAILASKHAHSIIKALPVLVEYRIAPAAWTLFSIMVWKNYVMAGNGPAWDSTPSRVRRPKQGTPPPPSWVFSLKRLEARTEWFAWHEAHSRGGRLRLSAAHKTLLRKYEALRLALLAAPSLNQSTVAALVAEHLPASVYTRLAAKAKTDAEYTQDELDAGIERGVWIW
jgi:hypothetical protein